MIVVDTSALAAMLFREPEMRVMARCVAESGVAYVGAPTAFELRMVALGRLGREGLDRAAILLASETLRVVDWTAPLVEIASDAFERYGKGRHAARLNYGDCMAYALAKTLDVPLLYKGGDFALTDVAAAL